MCFAWFARHKKWGPLLLRVVLGLILAAHGYQKLFQAGPAGVAGFLGGAGIPLPLASAWIVSLLEFGGGILLILGLALRPVALLLVLQFLVIMFLRLFVWKHPLIGQGGSYELDLLILAASFALLVHGSDKWALGSLFHKKSLLAAAEEAESAPKRRKR